MTRNESIIKLRNEGKTYREIAILFSISTERARQIYKAAKRNQARSIGLFNKLPARTRNAL